jgi:hypothetical protein
MDTEIKEQLLLETIESNNQKIIQNASNESKVRAIESENKMLKAELEQIRNSQTEQVAAQQIRFEAVAAEASYFLDNLIIEGLTMRELCADDPQYQMLRIAVQTKIISLSEDNSKLVGDIQAEEAEKQRQLRSELAQSKLETADYQSKLKAATDEIVRLEWHVDDLRKEIAVGARNAYKVTDVEQSEQLKQLAEQIKASRIHVFDVVPDSEINPKNYTAKRVDNGDVVSWNWTQSKNYVEVKDEAEAARFRLQFANQEALQDISLGNETPVDVVQEDIFPEIPSAIAPEINVPGEIQVAIPAPADGGQGQTVEERLSALEAHVFGYVKQAS